MDKSNIIYPWLSFNYSAQLLEKQHWSWLRELQEREHHLRQWEIPSEQRDLIRSALRAKFIRSCLKLSGYYHQEAAVETIYNSVLSGISNDCRSLHTAYSFCEAFSKIADYLFAWKTATRWRTKTAQFNHLASGLERNESTTNFCFRTAHRHYGKYAAVQPRYCPLLLEELRRNMFTQNTVAGVSREVDALLKGLLVHINFLLILPFEDGNMRTACLLQYALSRAAGVSEIMSFLPVMFFAENCGEYYLQIPHIIETNGQYSAYLSFALKGMLQYFDQQLVGILEGSPPVNS